MKKNEFEKEIFFKNCRESDPRDGYPDYLPVGIFVADVALNCFHEIYASDTQMGAGQETSLATNKVSRTWHTAPRSPTRFTVGCRLVGRCCASRPTYLRPPPKMGTNQELIAQKSLVCRSILLTKKGASGGR
jgi:hypothetical protein